MGDGLVRFLTVFISWSRCSCAEGVSDPPEVYAIFELALFNKVTLIRHHWL